ncbi:hypothetical protein COY27_03795 [Candidatus Woesearchaeota archaeon CG_4_10_14_0_2_um_filter_33_13]|nr:MAG: hypothetical protein COY27_03795 [Candidatus Woesearchaeota archaeon CG_4_10_14_0_2_um_filter_33_13]
MYNLQQELCRLFETGVAPLFSDQFVIRTEQKELVKQLTEVVSTHPSVQILLTEMKRKIGQYYDHSLRTGVLFLDLSLKQPGVVNFVGIPTLAIAGLLHDYGKTKIPPDILFKPAKLSEEERTIMNSHNQIGGLLLEQLQEREFPYLSQLVLQHHDYPRQGRIDHRKDERREYEVALEICNRTTDDRSLFLQKRYENPTLTYAGALLSLADYFDALSSPRDYKPAFSQKEVCLLIGSTHPGLEKELTYLSKRYGKEKA